MPQWDAETAVVGLGAWGAAALWRLAVRGVDVLGIDRRPPGQAPGSSHGGSLAFRVAGPEHPGLVPSAHRSRELWTELEDTGRTKLFVPSGGLLIGPEHGRVAGGALRAARAHGLRVRTYTATALRFQHPRHTGVPGHHMGVWDPCAGLVRADHAVRTTIAVARTAGARVSADTRVTSVEPVPGGVQLHTPHGPVRVRQAVLAAGPGLPALLPGLPLDTVRTSVTWFRPLEPSGDFEVDCFPPFLRELDDGRTLWGSGREGGHDVRLGLEDRGVAAKPVDPEEDDRSVTPDDWRDLARLLPAKIPGLAPSPARIAAGVRTRTPDDRPVIGRPDGDPRLIVATPTAPDDLTQAPAVGETVADLVQGVPPKTPLDFLSPNRFT
ncbi:FAD-dependent oxidoreductase [Streptomyces sp. NPDC002328]|uniref:FAD-dependent oxidoreductase n=1 Tax=Streptomyces sp. NPDC002328 TaxID=3364642 RepID=UPI0036CBBFE7